MTDEESLQAEFKNFKNQLIEEAEIPLVKKVSTSIPLDRYMNSANHLLSQIEYHRIHQDNANLFIFLTRFVCLYLNVLTKHPNKQVQHISQLKEMKTKAYEAMDSIEKVTAELKESFIQQRKEKLESERQQAAQAAQVSMFTPTPAASSFMEPTAPAIDLNSAPEEDEDESELSKLRKQLNSFADEFNNVQEDDNHHFASAPQNHVAPSFQSEQPQSSPKQQESTSKALEPLRPVYVNKKLVDDFLVAAHEHLLQDIELCGILCAQEHEIPQSQPGFAKTAYYVTHCLIPNQFGTRDSCQAVEESLDQLMMYQEKHKLVSVGWIHIHPTQTAFLSTVDLRNHLSYQLLLPEAIAIVCAPKQVPDLGVFRIRDEYSLDQHMHDHINGLERLQQLLKSNPSFGKEHEPMNIKLFEDCHHCLLSYEVSHPCQVIDFRDNTSVSYGGGSNNNNYGGNTNNSYGSPTVYTQSYGASGGSPSYPSFY